MENNGKFELRYNGCLIEDLSKKTLVQHVKNLYKIIQGLQQKIKELEKNANL